MHGSWFVVALYKSLHTVCSSGRPAQNDAESEQYHLFNGGHGHEDWMLHPPVLGDGRATAIQYLFPVIATNDTLYCREQYTQ